MRTSFIGPAYEGRSVNMNAQRSINLYPEIDPMQGKNVAVLHGTPGLELFTNVGASPIRGDIVAKSILYTVMGGKFYEILSNGATTEKGTILTSSGRVSLAQNGTQIIIVDGDFGYIYTIATGVLLQITDPDFPGADTVTFLDGYFVFNKPDTGSFMITSLYDGTAVDALDIKTAEGQPDNIVAVVADHRELWAFGEYTTEVFYNSGNADFPFDRIEGAFMEWGLEARWSVGRNDNTLFFLAKNQKGSGKVMMAMGYQPQTISTPAIEYQISKMAITSDAFGFCYTEEGHSFYELVFPSGGKTFVYDSTTRLWHERASRDSNGNLTRHRVNSYSNLLGSHIVGDYENGKLYKMKMDTYDENGTTIERIRRAPHLHKDLKFLFFNKFQLDFEAGVGLTTGQGSDPQIMLRWSDDGGHTWSHEHWKPMGKKGEYNTRAIWRRLGRSRDRIFEVKITDPVKVSLIGAHIEVSAGLH